MDETALEYEGPAFTDAALKAIPNLDKVEMLALWDTAVTDTGFGELLRAHALVEVSITSDTLSGAVLQVLARLPASAACRSTAARGSGTTACGTWPVASGCGNCTSREPRSPIRE